MCGVVIEEEDFSRLEAIGVKDSKKLTPKKREEIYKSLKGSVKHKLIVVEPEEIDRALNSPDINLNWLEAIHTAVILNELKPDKAIVDSPSNNKEAYKSYLGNLLKYDIELQMEHNAERFAPVAAASILAKVTRDRIIEELKKKYGDFGSGYPADPYTKSFLERNYDPKSKIFRHSWATCKKILKSRGQAKLNNFS